MFYINKLKLLNIYIYKKDQQSFLSGAWTQDSCGDKLCALFTYDFTYDVRCQ